MSTNDNAVQRALRAIQDRDARRAHRKPNTITRYDLTTDHGFEAAYDQAIAYQKRNPNSTGIKSLGQRDMIARHDGAWQTTKQRGVTVHKAQRAKVRQS